MLFNTFFQENTSVSTQNMMVNGAERPFDLVIFGASGYTGQCVIEYVVRAVEEEFKKQSGGITQKLRWV